MSAMVVHCAHTEMVDIDLLVPHPLNANKHPDEQIKFLAKIMRHQGWRHPITVSTRSGFIVAGHGRLAVAKLNGWTEAPVDRQDFASEADEYAHLIADNKIAELAETDMAMVQNQVIAFGETFPNFDIELLGVPNFHIGNLPLFEPGTEADQGKLDEKKMAVCPNCGEEFHPK
jgi:hypothetical protein